MTLKLSKGRKTTQQQQLLNYLVSSMEENRDRLFTMSPKLTKLAFTANVIYSLPLLRPARTAPKFYGPGTIRGYHVT